MKRYRVVAIDFDTRATILTMEINEAWAEDIKASNLRAKRSTAEGIRQEYGVVGEEVKRQNFIDLGSKPMSVLAFHNRFFEQIRKSFIVGGYYPALTGACALGERILNHLVLNLRDDFKGTPEYKKVYGKDSFDNWGLAIETLEKWNILLPQAVEGFKELESIRNASLHFRPEVDHNDRELALKAIRCLQEIIKNQFSAFGKLPWLFVIDGEVYLKKEWEAHPFIRKVYLKNCVHVGPNHRVMQTNPWTIEESSSYPTKEITDEEYAKLRKGHRG